MVLVRSLEGKSLASWNGWIGASAPGYRDSGGATRFAYLDIGVGGTIVEITEDSEGGGGMNDRIRDAAADWDGADPVRPLF